MNYLSFTAFFINFIFFVLQTVNVIFIREIVINVIIFNSFLSFLFAPKYQINPISNLLSHSIAFKHLPKLSHEKVRISTGPRRKVNMIDSLSALSDA